MQQLEVLEIGPATPETYDTREGWLAARRNGIGASEAPDVVGVGWRSPMTLYAEKLGLVEPDAMEAERLEWGLLLEPVIAARYEAVTGRRVRRPPAHTLYRSRVHPFMVFSPDGFVQDAHRGRGVLQIKTAGSHRAGDWDDEPPLAYQVQVQHELAVADVAWGALAVLIGGQRFRHYEIERNERFLATLIEREAEFFDRLQRHEPPAVDGSDATRELLRRLYPREMPGLVVNLPADVIEWDAALLEAKRARKAADDQITGYENQIKAALGDAEAGVCTNGVTYTWKASERKGYTVAPSVTRTLRRREEKGA